MGLKTDYKDYEFELGETKRKYRLINNSDGTISLDDVTTYAKVGDVVSASDLNSTNNAVNNCLAKTYSNIPVNVTPVPLSNYCAWDTQHLYGYKAIIAVNGLTANSLIQNIIMTDTLLASIGYIATTGSNSLTFYTQDNTPLSGMIITLITSEAA